MSWSRNEGKKGVHCVGLVVRRVGGGWENLVEGGKTIVSCCHFLLLFLFSVWGFYDKKWEWRRNLTVIEGKRGEKV